MKTMSRRRPRPQHQGRRGTTHLTALGCRQTFAAWHVATGIPLEVLWWRWHQGWEPDRIVSTPPRAHRARGDVRWW